MNIYEIHLLGEKKLYINKHYHELNDTGTSSCTLGLYAGNNTGLYRYDKCIKYISEYCVGCNCWGPNKLVGLQNTEEKHC